MLERKKIKTIADFIKNAADVWGEKTFIRYEKHGNIIDISYVGFYRRCEAIAAWIKEKSTVENRKVRIGIFGGCSVHFLSVLFGCMANGNVAIPLDVQMGKKTLIELINRADIDYLFYDRKFLDLVEEAAESCPNLKGIVCLKRRMEGECVPHILESCTSGNLNEEIDPNKCALVLFTSGTSGKEKGVMLSHDNLISNTFCIESDLPDENTVKLSVLPVHHVFSIHADFLITLRAGCIICLNQDMAKLGEHLQMFEPTNMAVVPMIAKALYNKIVMLHKQYPSKSMVELKCRVLGRNLKKMSGGGGYLPPELSKAYGEIGVLVAQGYGMTECSPKISTVDWDRMDKAASVGRLVKDCQIRFVNGEIQVKSPSVMMGYYKDPEETKKAITEDGWLRTGDLGYIDEEGFLYFTGRCKNLIVLSNGENVAPEQIESLFAEEKLIEEILVYGENDIICAEVYPNLQVADALGIIDLERTVDEIIQKHNQELPSYKKILKSHIRYLPFEKTSSKKIIRDKFFEQKRERENALAHYKKPENEIQQVIFECVAECLGHSEFGVDTDFREVGLDSMGSIMLLSALQDKLQMTISLQELAANATVEKLEQFKKEEKTLEIDYSVRETYPLFAMQLYMIFVMRGNTTSNLPFLFKLDQSIDLVNLKRAVEQVFEIHPEMKNRIYMHINRKELRKSGFVNHRDDTRKIEVSIVKLSDEAWSEVKKDFAKPFTYKKGEDLFRTGIYVTDSANYFYFEIAHAISDGVSMNIIFEDINALYKGEKLSKPSYTFYEFILDEEQRAKKGMTKESAVFFENLLMGAKTYKSFLNRSDFYDLKNGVNGVLRGNMEILSKRKVQAFCHRSGVSENIFFLTAFAHCLSIFSNDDKLFTTSIHSGRTDSRWQHIVGSVFLTYCYRYDKKLDEPIIKLLKNSAEQVQKIMNCGFSNMRADEILFQYQGNIIGISEIGGAPAELQRIPLDSMPFHMQVMEGRKGYFYELRYWKNRFEDAQLEVFLRCYQAVLQAMLTVETVRGIESYIPESDMPKLFYTEIGKLNKELGYELLSGEPSEEAIVCILDNNQKYKPYGAWGDLYIANRSPKEYKEKIVNPYEEGFLYKIGHTARITIDGKVELQEIAGRTVMLESYMGRRYVDLKKLETLICECKGVTSALAYTYISEDLLSMYIGIDVHGVTEKDKKRLKNYLIGKVPLNWMPKTIRCLP